MKILIRILSICLIFGIILSCKGQPPVDKVPLHTTLSVKSAILGEARQINIWLPPNYQQHAESVTVLYMPDGGIDEDFPHIANTLAELQVKKAIPPVMLVGIANIQRRKDMTSPSNIPSDKKIAPVIGGAAKFRAFISQELIPAINAKYKSNGKRGIIGESLAGLFVTETLFQDPGLFDFYIAFDPSLWWNNHTLINKTAASFTAAPKPTRFWFAGSSAADIFVHTRALNQLLNKQRPKNLTWLYSDEPKEEHSTIFRATKEKALIWSLNP